MSVYVLTSPAGKQYVGQTVNSLAERWAQHCGSAGIKTPAIYRAIIKYGAENFSMSILNEVNTKKEMDFYECLYIKQLNTKSPNGYNLTDGGDGTVGHRHSEATKLLISKLATRPSLMKGKKHTALAKNAMSLARKGRPCTDSQRMNLSKKRGSKWNLGRKASDKTKQKMSESRTGHSVGEAQRQKMRDYWVNKRGYINIPICQNYWQSFVPRKSRKSPKFCGRQCYWISKRGKAPRVPKRTKLSQEHKAKIGAASKGHRLSEEARRKISVAKTQWWARRANGS